MTEINLKGRQLFCEDLKTPRGTTALIIVDKDGEEWCVATIEMQGLNPKEVVIKNYSENEGVLEALVSSGVVSAPVRFVNSGFVTIPICIYQKAS